MRREKERGNWILTRKFAIPSLRQENREFWISQVTTRHFEKKYIYLTTHQLRNIVAVPPIDIFSWVRIDSILSDLYLILAIWGYGKRLKNIVSIDAIGVRPLFGALNVRFFFIFGIIGLTYFDFSILRHSYVDTQKGLIHFKLIFALLAHSWCLFSEGFFFQSFS